MIRRREGKLPWPPTPEAVAHITAAGLGDKRAALLFGVNARTFAKWRAEHVGRRLGDRAKIEAQRFGLDPGARWPASAKFEDDPAACVARDRLGRMPARATFVEGATTLALVAS